MIVLCQTATRWEVSNPRLMGPFECSIGAMVTKFFAKLCTAANERSAKLSMSRAIRIARKVGIVTLPGRRRAAHPLSPHIPDVILRLLQLATQEQRASDIGAFLGHSFEARLDWSASKSKKLRELIRHFLKRTDQKPKSASWVETGP